ncbi:MAG: dihydrofolate reductase [Patescibacteria group bacterium]|jgi:dihydrofolate reductase
MGKVVLYIAMTLDGYIASENGSIDWLKKYEKNTDGEDYGYGDMIAGMGSVIMGNSTYKQIQTFGEYPYSDFDSYVFTRNLSLEKDSHVTYVHDSVKELISSIQKKSDKDIWLIGGGKLISSFLETDLIDEYILTVVPILLGKGIPLFSGDFGVRNLKLNSTKGYKSGLMQMNYSC